MRKPSLVLVGLLALMVGGCGGASSATVADNGQIEISMFEFQYEPAEIHLKVGTTVTLVLTNVGAVDHELMAGKDGVHMENGVPHGFESDFFDTVEGLMIDPPDALETEMEGMGGESMDDMGSETTMGDMGSETTMDDMNDGAMDMDMGVMIARPPAETVRITFTLTQESIGEWEIGCFEGDGDHWEAGMKGTIVVESA